MRENNPFENEDVAKQWTCSVEGEKGMIRDNETYPALHQWFDTTKKGTVIDIGSGQGVCSSKIDGYEKYLGVEPSTFLVDRAKELYELSGREFLIGNAYELPVSDESCDNAFSVNVWFHLEDLKRASNELFRVLKPGGNFFIHTADSDALDVWKKFYKNQTIDGNKITGEVEVPVNNMTLNTFYMHTNDEVIEALKKCGLHISLISKLGKLTDDGKPIFIVIEGEKL